MPRGVTYNTDDVIEMTVNLHTSCQVHPHPWFHQDVFLNVCGFSLDRYRYMSHFSKPDKSIDWWAKFLGLDLSHNIYISSIS
jgi:hypothetical protein